MPHPSRRATLLLATALLAVVPLVGCGSKAVGVDGTVPVQGTVKLKGSPLAGATVTFAPSGSGRSASAVTAGPARILRLSKTAFDQLQKQGSQVGITMLFHCDYVIAGRNSKLSMPFVNLGLVPEAGSSYLLPLLAGHHRAAEMFMLGEVFSAQRGYEAGFINEVVDEDEVAVRAGERAKQLADQPRNAIRETKRLLREGHQKQLAAVMEEEARLFTAALSSDEAREAFMNFLMKNGKTRK